MKWGSSFDEFKEKGLIIEGTVTIKKDVDGTEITEVSGHPFILGNVEFTLVKYQFFRNKIFYAYAFFMTNQEVKITPNKEEGSR